MAWPPISGGGGGGGGVEWTVSRSKTVDMDLVNDDGTLTQKTLVLETSPCIITNVKITQIGGTATSYNSSVYFYADSGFAFGTDIFYLTSLISMPSDTNTVFWADGTVYVEYSDNSFSGSTIQVRVEVTYKTLE